MSSADTNIFGDDKTSSLDISDEGLEARWEAANESDLETIEDDTEGDDEDGHSIVGDEETHSVDEDDSEDDDTELVEDGDDEDLPAPLKGKSRQEIAALYAQAQEYVNRQGNELGELRKAVQQLQQNGYQAAEPVPTIDYIENAADAVSAYRQALDLLDQGQIGPDVVDEIIEVAHELDPAMGRKMDRDFGTRLARAEANVQLQPIQQAARETNILRATTEVYHSEADAAPYQDDIARILRQPSSLEEQQLALAYEQAQTAGEIKQVLLASIRLARGADPTRSTLYSGQLRARKKNERTEGGNATKTTAPPKSEVELIQDDILNRRRSDVDLFAGFGG
jgi:hypothetical protein